MATTKGGQVPLPLRTNQAHSLGAVDALQPEHALDCRRDGSGKEGRRRVAIGDPPTCEVVAVDGRAESVGDLLGRCRHGDGKAVRCHRPRVQSKPTEIGLDSMHARPRRAEDRAETTSLEVVPVERRAWSRDRRREGGQRGRVTGPENDVEPELRGTRDSAEPHGSARKRERPTDCHESGAPDVPGCDGTRARCRGRTCRRSRRRRMSRRRRSRACPGPRGGSGTEHEQ